MNKPETNSDPTTRALLFLYTETPLHVGCGEGLGAIDLPIQRERMSGLPVAPGSGIKGALRERFRGAKSPHEEELFGPPPPKSRAESKEPDHAGALTVTDARLLLMPIRTVYGGWAWATCPMILERLARDLEVVGEARPAWADLAPPESSALLFAEKSPIAPDGANLLLEDELYKVSQRASDPAGKALVEALKLALPASESYQPTQRRLAGQLVVLSDEVLKQWAQRGTEVATRVRIDAETGAVSRGALWVEEALPAESLLWSLAVIHDSRKPRAKEAPQKDRNTLLKAFAEGLPQRAFFGGDRTTGRGLCGLKLFQKGG